MDGFAGGANFGHPGITGEPSLAAPLAAMQPDYVHVVMLRIRTRKVVAPGQPESQEV